MGGVTQGLDSKLVSACDIRPNLIRIEGYHCFLEQNTVPLIFQMVSSVIYISIITYNWFTIKIHVNYKLKLYKNDTC